MEHSKFFRLTLKPNLELRVNWQDIFYQWAAWWLTFNPKLDMRFHKQEIFDQWLEWMARRQAEMVNTARDEGSTSAH